MTCPAPDRPAACPGHPILAVQSAWIPKEVFRLSHINKDWRLDYE